MFNWVNPHKKKLFLIKDDNRNSEGHLPTISRDAQKILNDFSRKDKSVKLSQEPTSDSNAYEERTIIQRT